MSNLLCVDPGKNNFAYSIIDIKNMRMIHYNLITKTISSLTDRKSLIVELNDFKTHMETIKNSNIKALVYERMVPRAFNMKGNVAEITNVLIGIMLSTINCKTVIPLTAATWKNFYKREKFNITNKTIPIHVTDSIQMGYYALIHHKNYNKRKLLSKLKKIENKNFGWKFKKGVWIHESPKTD